MVDLCSVGIGIPFFGKDVTTGAACNGDYTWFVWSMLATMFVVILNAIILSISHAFNMREMEAYSKSEMLQSGATFLMVIFLIAMIYSATVFSAQYFFGCTQSGGEFGTLTCPDVPCGNQQLTTSDSTVALDMLKCNVQERSHVFNELNRQAIEAAGDLMVKMSYAFSLMGIPVFQGAYVTSWFKQLESYRIVINLTANLLIASNAMVVVINYIKQNMLAFFLPLGLVLRSFHFTRGIGAFLIAFALGFYFIFPIVYTVTDPGFQIPSLPQNPNIAINNLACYPSFSGIIRNVFFTANTLSGSASVISLQSLTSDLSSIYTEFLFHPFIALSITLIFVRYMMFLLGGEAQDLMRFISKVV